MKIAVVFDGLGFGGIERVGIDYIRIMKDLGYEIDVYNLNPKYNQLEKELINICNIKYSNFSHKLCPELYSFGVKKWWWGKYIYPLISIILYIFLEIRKIYKKNYKIKYDIAIAFSGHINDLTFVAYNFIRADKKLCWLHGGLAEYLLICSGFGVLYRKIKNLCVLSKYGQEIALNGNKFLESLNIHQIYNPTYIQDKALNKEKIQELKNKYGNFLLMVGRFTKQKDQITVIKAIKVLKDEYGLEKKIVFIGDGEEKKKIKKLVKGMNLEEIVIFEGEKLDVQNYYKAAYLFIHSSPLEGLPTVLLEAMSYGLPIVATNSLPGVPEILKNNKYGLICEVGNEIEMAQQIYRLILDNELYDYYHKQSKIRIEDFQPTIISLKLKEIFKNLL